MGTLGAASTTTLAANPHLKAIFGYPPETPPKPSFSRSTRPRFVDPQARTLFIDELDRDGVVTDHLLRLRRVDGAPIWVEVTGHRVVSNAGRQGRPLRPCMSRRSSATSASARSATTSRATAATSCCRPRRWPRSARPSRASRTS